MLRKQQVSSETKIAEANPGLNGTPFVSHILIAQDVRHIALYDATGKLPSATPVWAKDNAQAGDIYLINCPFMTGITVDVEGGVATVVWDMMRP